MKPEISHFTPSGVAFRDGTFVSDIDALVLGTGYDLRLPFLEEGHALYVNASAKSNETYTEGLVTNLRYLFPVHEHVFSLCPNQPTNALAFVGLPIYVANCPSDAAQSLYIVHAIANSRLLPPRDKLLEQLALEEERLRSLGFDPYQTGHKILPIGTGAWDYENRLVRYLKEHGALPNDGKDFVEDWRRVDQTYLKRGWRRIEELGTQGEWLKGVQTEADWADLIVRINKWQGDWERKHGLFYVDDTELSI